MVTTSKDKVQCFKKAGYVTCKDNTTGRQLRKNKKGVNATPGTIRVKKSDVRKAAKQKAKRPAIKMTNVAPKKKKKAKKPKLIVVRRSDRIAGIKFVN